MALPDYEQSVLDRLDESNPLGWRPWKRDENGIAMLKCDHKLPDGNLRRSVVKLTPKGMVYEHPVVVPDLTVVSST